MSSIGIVSIKHGTISHGIDSARPTAHEPIVHENNRAPYRLDSPPIQHRLDLHESVMQKRLGTGSIVHESVLQKRFSPARLYTVVTVHQWT